MPKIVDVDLRRDRILAAVHRLVERGGIEAASLRNVADEAGLNIGSVRHYVDSHEALLVLAIERLERQVQGRIEPHARRLAAAGPGERLDITLDLLEELLPLDEERRHEVVLYFAFCEASRARPALRPVAQRLVEGVHEAARLVVIWARGELTAGRDVAATTLAASLDGMAFAALHAPQQVPRERMRAVLAAQLEAMRG